MSSDQVPQPRADPDAQRRFRWYTVSALLGAGLALLVFVLWLRHSAGPRAPLLTAARFREAVDRWSAAGPESYNVQVVVQGPQPATYRVEVRRRDVQAAFLNDRLLSAHRTWGTWSVPGMFGTIGRDLDSLQRQSSEGGSSLELRAAFDPQYGYPTRYERRQFVAHGDNMVVTWNVIRFDVVADAEPVSGTEPLSAQASVP